MKISETEVKKFRKHDAVTTSSKPTVWQGLQSPPDQSGLDSQLLLHYVTLKPAKTVYMAQVSIVVDWQETQTSMLHCDRASQLVTNEVHPTKSPLTFGCADGQCFNTANDTSHGLLHRTAPAVFIFPDKRSSVHHWMGQETAGGVPKFIFAVFWRQRRGGWALMWRGYTLS